ncbi:MAG: indole-3-glycerol phosphate synthase TrpC [Anaerolineae bacterium]
MNAPKTPDGGAFLTRILADTRATLAARKARRSLDALRAEAEAAPPPRDLAAALRVPGVSVIAEIKRASPSHGALNLALDPAALACIYARAGAVAISVLTEETHFGGSLTDLSAVRAAQDAAGHQCPILRKDFVLDAYQLYEARAAGADAVLLIAAALADADLADLLQGARALGLTPLVEVHNEAELHRVLPLNPPVVGINHRDLRTFQVDLGLTHQLRPLVPAGTLLVAESGIRTPEDLRTLAAEGVDAVLVGEALVRAPHPAALLRAFLEAVP